LTVINHWLKLAGGGMIGEVLVLWNFHTKVPSYVPEEIG
jgi:hypothetical protein